MVFNSCFLDYFAKKPKNIFKKRKNVGGNKIVFQEKNVGGNKILF